MTTIEKIIKVAYEVRGEVRRGYSGRYMYGRTCYGIVTDNPGYVVQKIKGGSID